ncbi:MAG TPA: hypothetical protein VF698_18015 [Thermoanaerobaculia bacterium]|jgi:plastocyanin
MKRIVPLLLCAGMFGASVASAAVVSGTVTFMTKRGQRPNFNETLLWLEPVDAKTPRKPASAFTITTRGKAFVPHVMAVPAGSTIAFPNEDPISHNLFSLTPGNTFDLGLYRKGAGKTHKFDAPGAVNVYCNVHPNMSAVVHVMPTPYYGFADANGNYSFDVPPGKYRLVAWNEQGGSVSSDIAVAANGVTGNRTLLIDSRNHRGSQHTNKFGQTYQAPKEY